MSETGEEFQNFRALNAGGNAAECDTLIRNMAKLFVHVAERCDDEQIEKYDDILCKLSEVVELEARKYVSEAFCKLPRAPGTVVAKLAGDESIEVAGPILEFSPLLTDDDLIEIVSGRSELHRVAIAGRAQVNSRVSGALFEHGQEASLVRLADNENAEIIAADAAGALSRLGANTKLQDSLKARSDLDWRAVQAAVIAASNEVSGVLSGTSVAPSLNVVKGAQAVAYNKFINKAGFSREEWLAAWGQVQGLNDRKKLNNSMIMRFCRFGYGHHVAAGFTKAAAMPSAAMLTWLARGDLIAVTVALRAHDFDLSEFQAIIAILPWAEPVTPEQIESMADRFDSLPVEEAADIFAFWRRHGFREAANGDNQVAVQQAS